MQLKPNCKVCVVVFSSVIFLSSVPNSTRTGRTTQEICPSWFDSSTGSFDACHRLWSCVSAGRTLFLPPRLLAFHRCCQLDVLVSLRGEEVAEARAKAGFVAAIVRRLSRPRLSQHGTTTRVKRNRFLLVSLLLL